MICIRSLTLEKRVPACLSSDQEMLDVLEYMIYDRGLSGPRQEQGWKTISKLHNLTPKFEGGEWVYRTNLKFIRERNGTQVAESEERRQFDEMLEAVMQAGHSRGWHVKRGGVRRTSRMPKVPQAQRPSARVKLPWFEQASIMLDNGFPLLLEGPRGTGKTTYARNFALERNLPFYSIETHSDLMATDLMGEKELQSNGQVMQTTFLEGPLLKAAREGGVFLLDEFNLARPGVPAVLNSILSGGFLTHPHTKEHIDVHPDFRAILCCNPGYAGTRMQNEALQDRCVVIHCTYWPPALERQVLLREIPALAEVDVDRMLEVAKAARAARDKGDIDFDLSIRTLRQWAIDADRRTQSLLTSFEDVVLNKVGTDPVEHGPQRAALREIARLVLGE